MEWKEIVFTVDVSLFENIFLFIALSPQNMASYLDFFIVWRLFSYVRICS
jgi:hypothetical protein